ncbi:hypothetical protein CR513_09395, partial [Mucuna pruriens]
IVLGCTDSDLALRVEKLTLTPENLREVKNEKWKCSNRMYLMIMKRLILKRFGTLFLKVKGKENTREDIIEMSNLAAKFKSLKLESGEDLIVHLVLISLFTHFRLQRVKTENTHFALTYQNKKRRTLRMLRKGLLNKRKLGVKKAKDVLELIHTNICGPFPTTSWNGQQYFITFIDDYSRYAVKSYRGGEYYGRYGGSGEQCPGPFALFLKECGILKHDHIGRMKENWIQDIWGCLAEA